MTTSENIKNLVAAGIQLSDIYEDLVDGQPAISAEMSTVRGDIISDIWLSLKIDDDLMVKIKAQVARRNHALR